MVLGEATDFNSFEATVAMHVQPLMQMRLFL